MSFGRSFFDDAGFKVYDPGFRMWDVGFNVIYHVVAEPLGQPERTESRLASSEFGSQCQGFRVQGLEAWRLRISGLGFGYKVYGLWPRV